MKTSIQNAPERKKKSGKKEKCRDLPKEGRARPAQVAFAFGVSRSTINNWIRNGSFPKPNKEGCRYTYWPVEVVREELRRRNQAAVEAESVA